MRFYYLVFHGSVERPSYLLTFTCVGIHSGRVEPASPVELTTSRTEALQARRSCASSLDTFAQSFLHRALPKTRGPKSGSKSALIVVVHVFSWPPARLHHVRGGVGRRSLISSPSGRRRFLCTSSAGILVRQAATQFLRWHTISALYVIAKDLQHPFVGYSYRPCLATVEQNRAHYCLVDAVLCTQRYFTPRPKTRLQARECGTKAT